MTSSEYFTSSLVPSNSGLRCIRFWYYLSNTKIYGSEIGVHLNACGQPSLLWRTSCEKEAWQYVQIPLTYKSDFTVGIKWSCPIVVSSNSLIKILDPFTRSLY